VAAQRAAGGQLEGAVDAAQGDQLMQAGGELAGLGVGVQRALGGGDQQRSQAWAG
jgi:hypothetical protein